MTFFSSPEPAIDTASRGQASHSANGRACQTAPIASDGLQADETDDDELTFGGEWTEELLARGMLG
jgi:hypothetical protein